MKFDKTTGKYSFKKLGLMKGFPELVDSLDYYPNHEFLRVLLCAETEGRGIKKRHREKTSSSGTMRKQKI